jgi:N-acetylglucosaminyl-diphospho-decaprenol L-rhamnosyltransferase
MQDDTARVDAVVVSYNSRETLRDCVAPLCGDPGVTIPVVDNASPDGTPATVTDLPVRLIQGGRNGGFAFGCNIGIAAGRAPYVLLLNPDARIERDDLDTLVRLLDADPALALAAPRILGPAGELQRSQRRFPRVRSTWAQALFLHRVAPHAGWADEVIWDGAAYEQPGSPDWVSGACMLVRRDALAQIGGLDERFFLYCEDIDLCRRLRAAGHDLRFEPAAEVRHIGGHSAPGGSTTPIYARSRIAYARKHYTAGAVPVERAGVALGEATHALAAVRRPSKRRGHLAAMRAVLQPLQEA